MRVGGITTISLVALASLFLLPAAAWAKPGSILISPPTVSLDINAGQSVTGTISLVDDGDESIVVDSGVTPYGVSGEDYNQSFLLAPGQTDVSKWITLTTQHYVLKGHQQAQAAYKVTVPNGIASGGYYAMVYFQNQPEKIATSGISTVKRVGSIFYIRVNGNVDEQGNLESFNTANWQANPPLVGIIRMGNRGNVHYNAEMTMIVSDVFGNQKAKITTHHEILPQTIRRTEIKWDKAPKLGLFKVGGNVNYLGRNEALPAHYVLVASKQMMAFLIAAAAILILLVLGLVWRQIRRRRR